jgi:uncharacterized protein YndB with AHSA1/START domain
MAESKFVYVTYIRTTPEKLWQALIDPEFTRKYWVETIQVSDWKKGSPWKLQTPDGRTADSGEVVEFEPPRRYAVTWRHELNAETAKEGYSRMACELEPQGTAVKLTIAHEMPVANSKLIEGVSGGWPMILASLKSLLETGESIEETRRWPSGM